MERQSISDRIGSQVLEITGRRYNPKCYNIDDSGMIQLAHFSQNLRQINLSYSSVTDVGLLSLASISSLQSFVLLHQQGLAPGGLVAALLTCGGLTKVKLHSSTRFMLPEQLIKHIEARG
ncbi:hypothetical protein HN51_022924 [Arachis hypogaea]|nr:F-box/LRR-repeat protein [Arachis hypogaea]